jgi:hypothetical protein
MLTPPERKTWAVQRSLRTADADAVNATVRSRLLLDRPGLGAKVSLPVHKTSDVKQDGNEFERRQACLSETLAAVVPQLRPLLALLADFALGAFHELHPDPLKLHRLGGHGLLRCNN